MKSFKRRKIDPLRPVRVHRNLHKSCYSISQGGKVVAHAKQVALKNAKFEVNLSGHERALLEQRRNVHAWVHGSIVDIEECPVRGLKKVRYNPFECPYFQKGGKPVWKASTVVLKDEGCFTS